MRAKELYMLLDIRILSVYCLVKCLLCVRPPLISTFPPLHLDRVPSFLSCPSGFYAKSSNIHTVESYVSTGKLITKHPLVVAWSAGVNSSRIGSRGPCGWCNGFRNISVDVSSKSFRSE